MKSPFKVGDLVRAKRSPQYGVGEVIGFDTGARTMEVFVKVRWPDGVYWPHESVIEPAENPIERMKRLYSEE